MSSDCGHELRATFLVPAGSGSAGPSPHAAAGGLDEYTTTIDRAAHAFAKSTGRLLWTSSHPYQSPGIWSGITSANGVLYTTEGAAPYAIRCVPRRAGKPGSAPEWLTCALLAAPGIK